MRLTPYEIASIQECAARHFGAGAVVRLFGSRVRDDLRGGDIDLHITTEQELGSYGAPASRFRIDLEERIGEQRIDVLVNGPGGPVQPIEKIAVLTGKVIGGADGSGGPNEVDQAMLTALHRTLLENALESGDKVRTRIVATVDELSPRIPFDEPGVAAFDREASLLTDSLLMQFNNFVAIVQDQLIRTLLLSAGRHVAGMPKGGQLKQVQDMGALPREPGFDAITKARNRVAHQYPARPAKQAEILNEVVEAIPIAVKAYDALAAFSRNLLATEDEA